MSDFKVGDKIWSVNQFGAGNLYPEFCEYTILDIAEHNTYYEWLVLENYQDYIADVYSRFCFKSKNEAIDALIKHIESFRDE